MAAVLGAGVAVTAVSFELLSRWNVGVFLNPTRSLGKSSPSSPLKMGFSAKENRVFDWKLFVGASLFGVGWGLSGVCPGPAVVNIGLLNPIVVTFAPSMFIGMIAQELIAPYI